VPIGIPAQRSTIARAFIEVKADYRLWVSSNEKRVMKDVRDDC
jgi:hypothetical protein